MNIGVNKDNENSHTATFHVILFYKYVVVNDVKSLQERQTALCQELGISGRIRVAEEGINGLLSGSASAIAKYRSTMNGDALFGNIQYKQSTSKFCPFNGHLLVRICKEITSTGSVMMKSLPTALGGSGGEHLSPSEFHEAILRCQRKEKVNGRKQILIDTRNHYETAVGTFKGAVDPKIRSFAQFPEWVSSNKEKIKDADVYMFCTGGIRCEKASSYLKSLDLAGSVSQLKGGIHSYIAEFSEDAKKAGVAVSTTNNEEEDKEKKNCQWQGVNFTFDGRLASPSAGKHGEYGRCIYCGSDCSELRADVACNVCKDLLLICKKCQSKAKKDQELRKHVETKTEHEIPERKHKKRKRNCTSLSETVTQPTNQAIAARLSVEKNSPYLCTEHSLLSSEWKSFLTRVISEGLPRNALLSALSQLRKQLQTSWSEKQRKQSCGKSGKSRRKKLQIQIERLEEFLGVEKVIIKKPEGKKAKKYREYLAKKKGTVQKKEDLGSEDDGTKGLQSVSKSEYWNGYFPILNLFHTAYSDS
eukprot:g879.t1